MIQLLKIFSFSTLIILLISGCQVKFNKKQTFVNDFIPIAIRKEITALDNRVFKAIETNDPRKISDIISPELWEVVGDKIDTLFSVTSGILNSGEIIKLDDLYVENMNRNVLNRIFSGLSNDDNYFIIYKALTKDVFISLNRVTDEPNELLITLIYGKTNNGWKLYHIQFGTYSLYGKTAVDYYKIAKRFDSIGHIVDAANALVFAEQTLKPGNQLWQYFKEKEIINLQNSVRDKINKRYKFPYVVGQIATKPEIFQIYPRTFRDRYETEIRYFSHINLEDTVALKKENDQLKLVIGDIFKGIDKEKECLIFMATNDYPDGGIRPVRTYGFVQEF